MPAATDRQRQVMRPGEVHGLGHVRRVRTDDHEVGPSVVHRVEDVADLGEAVVGGEHLAADALPEVVERRPVRGGVGGMCSHSESFCRVRNASLAISSRASVTGLTQGGE